MKDDEFRVASAMHAEPEIMENVVSTVALIDSLTDAITAAADTFSTNPLSDLPPSDGISLLDIKNDLLLSYLHNLVFLVILRLRHGQGNPEPDTSTNEKFQNLNGDIVRRLIELRVYIDRGIRPLEGRLRYQIDKVLRAAEDAERSVAQRVASKGREVKKVKDIGKHLQNGSSAASHSESESDISDDSLDVGHNKEDEEAEETLHRPNVAALAKKMKADAANSTMQSGVRSGPRSREAATGVYKPPRITPTSMPLPASARDRDYNDDRARRRKSNLLNEYIDEEVSTAPQAQPSIGSNRTILDRGRAGLSAKDREKQRERLEYEETNFIRLPGESKAERRKARQRGEQDRRDMFGGEDWTGLGGLGDKINSNVERRGGSSVLERREKRRRPTEDGPRGDGMAIGDTFSKRQKVLEDRADRRRKRKG